jgi:ParB-like chromosome segregation protein Spo0J
MTGVLDLPIAHLATTLAPLRGPRTDPASALAPLPVRVAANDDGTYEVLDGFKRVARWIADSHTHVPAVVEEAPGVVRKARLLEANAPRRTLSAMDEARVVRSLADDDQLTAPQMAKLLGRGRGWVERRLTLGRRLAPVLAPLVDAGRLSATTAQSLAAYPRAEQPRLGGRGHHAPRPAHARGRRLPDGLAGRGRRRPHSRGAAARSARGRARASRPRRLAPRGGGPRASGAVRSDRTRPRRAADPPSHRLR